MRTTEQNYIADILGIEDDLREALKIVADPTGATPSQLTAAADSLASARDGLYDAASQKAQIDEPFAE